MGDLMAYRPNNSQPGNQTFTSATSGATETLTVSNTSNTASSQANLVLSVAGTSAGDAYSTYTVSGTTTWTEGVDNSVSGDPFVLAASSALGTTNVMSITTGGAATFPLGNLDVTKSASGVDVSITASNTSNTATSTATAYLTVAGSTANDARVQYAVSGTTTWTQGIDNSDSDAYVLAASATLGTTNVIRASTAGEVTMPLQPAFLAVLNTGTSDVTGDSTSYTIIYDTEVFDQNSDYNLGTGTFTAPVTGKYQIQNVVRLVNGTSINNTSYSSIITSNNTYRTFTFLTTATRLMTSTSVLADMDAGDTFTVIVNATDSGGKIDDLGGSASGEYANFCSCFLAC